MNFLDIWICVAVQTFILAAVLVIYHNYFFTDREEEEVHSAPQMYQKEIEFDDAFHIRLRNLIDTKEKCDALNIPEPVHVLRYFILPPVSTKLTKDITLNTSCPLVGFVGKETNRIYFFPVLILFPDLQG